MTNILWFKDVGKEDIDKVGGKGANLGEMFEKFSIPNGFCVTVDAYKEFVSGVLDEILEILNTTDKENTKELEDNSKKIRELILKQNVSEELEKDIIDNYNKLGGKVAVRSSATAEDLPTASFAGQQDTYLNVEEGVIDSVKKCWASLFTARAIYYREKNNFKHKDVFISVVVQQMINPSFAGVMFTVDPIHKKFILIEMVEGLGEKLVSGTVTPNTFFLDKDSYEVTQENIEFEMDKSVLKEIAEIGKKIEEHYGYPQDIEFAIDKNKKLFILQSRNITTLQKND